MTLRSRPTRTTSTPTSKTKSPRFPTFWPSNKNSGLMRNTPLPRASQITIITKILRETTEFMLGKAETAPKVRSLASHYAKSTKTTNTITMITISTRNSKITEVKNESITKRELPTSWNITNSMIKRERITMGLGAFPSRTCSISRKISGVPNSTN